MIETTVEYVVFLNYHEYIFSWYACILLQGCQEYSNDQITC